jgi:hypothetical protein
LGSRLPTHNESRTRVHGRTTTSCEFRDILRVWPTCKVNNSEKWPTQAYRHPLNKSMRHMDNSGNIDLMIKLRDAGGINELSIGTGRITSQRSKL